MKKHIKIGKQIGLSYFFRALTLILGPLFIALLTRSLTIENYGIYSLLAITITIASIVLEFGFSQFIISKLSFLNFKSKTKSFFSLILFDFFCLIFIFTIILTTSIKKNIIQFLNIDFSVLLLMFIIILATSINRLYLSYLTSKKKIELQSIFSFLGNSLKMLFLFIFFWIFKIIDIKSILFLWFLSIFLTLVFEKWYLRKEISIFIKRKGFSFNYIKKALLFSLPLVPFLLGNWIIEIGDRYILNYYHGPEIVGLYTLPYALISVIMSSSIIISSVLFPYLSEAWHKKKKYDLLFNSAIKYSLLILIPASIGFYVLGTPIITLVAGTKYLASLKVIPFLIFYPLLNVLIYLFYQNLLFRNKTKTIGIIYIFGAGINIALNIILIPSYGIIGAAISTIISYLLIFIITLFLTKKYFKLNFAFLKIRRILFASGIMGIILYLIEPRTVIFKISAILIGAILYCALVYLLKIFSQAEIELIKRLLPLQKRK